MISEQSEIALEVVRLARLQVGLVDDLSHANYLSDSSVTCLTDQQVLSVLNAAGKSVSMPIVVPVRIDCAAARSDFWCETSGITILGPDGAPLGQELLAFGLASVLVHWSAFAYTFTLEPAIAKKEDEPIREFLSSAKNFREGLNGRAFAETWSDWYLIEALPSGRDDLGRLIRLTNKVIKILEAELIERRELRKAHSDGKSVQGSRLEKYVRGVLKPTFYGLFPSGTQGFHRTGDDAIGGDFIVFAQALLSAIRVNAVTDSTILRAVSSAPKRRDGKKAKRVKLIR